MTSRFEVVLPFVVTEGWIIVQGVMQRLAVGRVQHVASIRQRITALPAELRPGAISQYAEWAIDLSTSLGALLTPLIALLLLQPDLGNAGAVGYVIAPITGMLLFYYVWRQKAPSRWARKKWFSMSPVEAITLLANIAAGLCAYLWAP